MATAYADKKGGKHTGNTVAGAWIAIAQSNSTKLDPVPKALFVGGAGTLVLGDEQGDVIIITMAAAGVVPFAANYVLASGNDGFNSASGSYDHSSAALTVYALF